MKHANDYDRNLVYGSIDSELTYQWVRFGPNPHEIDAFATYIRRYVAILDKVATEPNTENAKLNVIRKIAALCVRCMEQHGAPRRKLPRRRSAK